ncbi:MAG: Wzt carbohydrate-binding domain-containing protein [Candidatus Peregrinibacteria bacterium]|nr:Wzt carbohydrate-binding domain-containing protein [Candidatus Peregrinibacteria bacterium]MDZ4245452.1 Wzt carbohydrate-binding domain-containing protein [Candidatus Gracilibacteria bacterium]
MKQVISVQKVSKKFLIPHEKKTTLKEHFVHLFNKTTYETFEALNDISFEIKKGEFVGIIGANGSGKSTLLKIISGIYSPTKGMVNVSGKISPFLELGVGFDPELSGAENVYLNAAVLGLSKKEIDARYKDIVAFAELERFMDMKVKNYSSGMFVRLAFSVAIQVDADILIMDEVLAVGDARFQEKCFNVFRKFKEEGKTIVFVTHDIGSIRRFCDRCLYLKKGELVAQGAVEKVIDQYIYQQAEGFPTVVNDVTDFTVIEPPVLPPVETPKVVEINDVKFIDKFGNLSDTFVSEDPIIIRVRYLAFSYVEKPIFGIRFTSEHDECIFGTNTELEGFRIESIEGKGFFDFKIDKLHIACGKIMVTVAIRQEGGGDHFDWKDKAYSFYVTRKDSNAGNTSLDVSFDTGGMNFVENEDSEMLKGKIEEGFFLQNVNPKSFNMFDEKWDVLFLIDACRFDLFEQNNKFIEGELSKKISLASCTPEWAKKSMIDHDLSDIIYISANPFVSRNYLIEKEKMDVNFFLLEELWDTGWDTKLKTVLPGDVTNLALKLHKKYPDKKIFVHYIQPHHPFIGEDRLDEGGWEMARDNILGNKNHDKKMLNIYEQLKNNQVTKDEVWMAYKGNLELILKEIRDNLPHFKGKKAISSDHGDCFGEYGIYAHPGGLYIPELIEVPWFEIKE